MTKSRRTRARKHMQLSSKARFDARVRNYSNISLVASIILLFFGAIIAAML